MKTLIVDESSVSYANLSALLEKLGVEVLEKVATENEITRTIEQHHPELILMDTRCSYLNGIHTIRKIKELYPEINLVVITVFEDSQSVKNAFVSGVQDIITKPIESQRLVSSLQKLGLLSATNGSEASPEPESKGGEPPNLIAVEKAV
ncbi:response regulator [Effusibacillus dendaii]|uniref:Response regulatory domain-containing protein n=1 Tax=Effusibacillus dendaii TaxID=2743772 RepID=A0A7I8DJ04_9BACL|nr:response regulator [Effusibacillus dendaii]BCJ87821.1 hypothetical protein skT53_28060 [Effusibacillus dendaii]